MAAIRISFAGCSMASPPRGWPRIRISGSCSSILPTRNTIPDALGILSGVSPLPFERDVELATLLLEAIPREPRLGVAYRRAGSDVELPHVLQAGQDGSVVDPLLERVGVVDDHRTVAALRKAAGPVDAHVARPTGVLDAGAKDLHVVLRFPLLRACLTVGTDEHVAIVWAHRRLLMIQLDLS